MLDLKFIAENADHVKTKLSTRSGSYNIDEVIELCEERRRLIQKAEELKARRNAVSAEIAILKRSKQNADALIKQMQEEGEQIKQLDQALSDVEGRLSSALLNIPNLPQDDVPQGSSDADNCVVRTHLPVPEFEFEPLPHWEIGEKLNILDAPTAAKITGARFTVYRGAGARLERSLINLMLDTHTERGYTEVLTPFLANKDSMTGTGQLPKFEEDMFAVKDTNYYLIPTAEVTVTNLYRDSFIDESLLPLSVCAYSACFRAEAGSAGRDTRGLIRQHQFNKVELVKFCHPQQSSEEHEKLTADAENILKILGLPYRVSLLCTGDTGFSSSKTYDLEVWMPSYGKYVEISSCSNFLSYQARRAGIKYRNSGKPDFVHTLNGSGLAVGRTVAAILENFQNADGSVNIPPVLQKYMGTDIIK